MKALKHSPEMYSDRLDKYGKEIKGFKPKKDSVAVVPFGMMSDFQVHVQSYIQGLGKVDAYSGKGSETLFVRMNKANDVNEVQNKARSIHHAILKGDKL